MPLPQLHAHRDHPLCPPKTKALSCLITTVIKSTVWAVLPILDIVSVVDNHESNITSTIGIFIEAALLYTSPSTLQSTILRFCLQIMFLDSSRVRWSHLPPIPIECSSIRARQSSGLEI